MSVVGGTGSRSRLRRRASAPGRRAGVVEIVEEAMPRVRAEITGAAHSRAEAAPRAARKSAENRVSHAARWGSVSGSSTPPTSAWVRSTIAACSCGSLRSSARSRCPSALPRAPAPPATMPSAWVGLRSVTMRWLLAAQLSWVASAAQTSASWGCWAWPLRRAWLRGRDRRYALWWPPRVRGRQRPCGGRRWCRPPAGAASRTARCRAAPRRARAAQGTGGRCR